MSNHTRIPVHLYNNVPSVALAKIKAQIELLLRIESLDQDILNGPTRRVHMFHEPKDGVHKMQHALSCIQREMAFALYEKGVPLEKLQAMVDIRPDEIDNMIQNEYLAIRKEKEQAQLLAGVDPVIADKRLDQMGLSNKACNHLLALGARLCRDLVLMREESVFMEGYGVGPSTFDEIRAFMTANNLSFRKTE